MVKNKGQCILEPKQIQWNVSDGLHNSAAVSWVCVTGHVMRLAFEIEAKEF